MSVVQMLVADELQQLDTAVSSISYNEPSSNNINNNHDDNEG